LTCVLCLIFKESNDTFSLQPYQQRLKLRISGIHETMASLENCIEYNKTLLHETLEIPATVSSHLFILVSAELTSQSSYQNSGTSGSSRTPFNLYSHLPIQIACDWWTSRKSHESRLVSDAI